jgi:hypothetical protein
LWERVVNDGKITGKAACCLCLVVFYPSILLHV